MRWACGSAARRRTTARSCCASRSPCLRRALAGAQRWQLAQCGACREAWHELTLGLSIPALARMVADSLHADWVHFWLCVGAASCHSPTLVAPRAGPGRGAVRNRQASARARGAARGLVAEPGQGGLCHEPGWAGRGGRGHECKRAPLSSSTCLESPFPACCGVDLVTCRLGSL